MSGNPAAPCRRAYFALVKRIFGCVVFLIILVFGLSANAACASTLSMRSSSDGAVQRVGWEQCSEVSIQELSSGPRTRELGESRELHRSRPPAFGYKGPARATSLEFVATNTGGEAGTGADSHGGGKNDQHGDGGRRGETLEQQIQDAKDQLADLNRTQGPKRDKVKLGNKIRNLEQEARDAASGENHSQRPKR